MIISSQTEICRMRLLGTFCRYLWKLFKAACKYTMGRKNQNWLEESPASS